MNSGILAIEKTIQSTMGLNHPAHYAKSLKCPTRAEYFIASNNSTKETEINIVVVQL